MKKTTARILFVSAFVSLLILQAPLFADSRDVEQAQQAAANGEVKAAIIQLKNVLQQDPENAQARLALGRIYLQFGDAASAEKELRRAQQLGTSVSEVGELLLDAYLAQAKFDDIARYLQKNNAENNSLQATFKAFDGFVQLSRKANNEAKVLFEQAIALDEGNSRAVLGLASYHVSVADDKAAIDLLSDFNQRVADDEKILALRAELYRKQGQLAEAEADFNRVLEINANHHKARLGLAFVQVTQKQADNALATIARLPEQSANSPIVNYLKAVGYFIKNDQSRSLEYLQQVLKMVPDHLQSHLLSGVINYSQGKWQLAEDHLRRVNKSMPTNASIAKLLAATYLKLQQPDKTVKLLKGFSLNQENQDAQLASLLGSAYLQLGENNLAQEWLSKAVEIAPDQAGMRTQLALGMLAGGNTGNAISTLQSAVDLGQDLIQTDVLLVMSHLKAGDTKKAIEVSEKLQDKYQDNPIPFNLAGLSYLADRQFDKAEQKFVRALEIDPKFEVAQLNRARNKIAAGNLAGAETHFKQILKASPENVTALLGLSQLPCKMVIKSYSLSTSKK